MLDRWRRAEAGDELDVELREGAVIANRFRLVRQLGRGGMGEVWAAQHTSLDIPCAVKFIHAESASKPEVRARFEREAKASAQLRTPNVVQILDYGIWENTPYIAMEYLDGEPLNARLKRRGRLDPHETFRIIAGVGKGLGKAHQAGIVHRDLKPENVFLVPDDGQEIAKVLDFGVAKETTALDSNTKTGALLGTPYYMSPEQAQGTKTVDHRADLWSLAVVAFRCLTGELPFKSHALGDLLIKIVTHPIPMPSHVHSGVPEGFDAWWARAAERDPARRFQSAKELVESLGLALNVSMPSTLGTGTPMPGASPPQVMRTMAAQPHELPGGGGALPFADPSTSSGAYPAAPQAVAQPAGQVADPTTNDAYGASVGGVATQTPAARGGGSKVAALVGVVAAIAVVGAIGAFLFLREGPSAASADTTETAAEETAEAVEPEEEPPAEVVEPEPDEGEDEDPEPDESATADSAETEPSAAPVAAPPPVPRPPRPSPPPPAPKPTSPDTPKPTPKPSPKPDGYDPGF